jgi:hypothetical protein
MSWNVPDEATALRPDAGDDGRSRTAIVAGIAQHESPDDCFAVLYVAGRSVENKDSKDLKSLPDVGLPDMEIQPLNNFNYKYLSQPFA